MKSNKIRELLIFVCYIITAFFSNIQCIEEFKEGTSYKIINSNNKYCLQDNCRDNQPRGQGTACMNLCSESEYGIHSLWTIKKHEEYLYKINSKDSGDCLQGYSDQRYENTVGMERCVGVNDRFYEDQLWYINGGKIINKGQGNCLNGSGFDKGNGTAGIEPCQKGNLHRTWNIKDASLEECQIYLKKLQRQYQQYQLLTSSFLTGTAYTLIPEIIRDYIEHKGYTNASDITAKIIQGIMIFYNTPKSFPSIATGLATKSTFKNILGFSDETSAVIGTTSAIAISVYQNLASSQDPTLDCIMSCAIAFAGSFAGSVFALQVKSWICRFWR